MGLQMEIKFKEDVSIQEYDKLYLDFDAPVERGEKGIVYLCVTRPGGSQITPKADVVHGPTHELLY